MATPVYLKYVSLPPRVKHQRFCGGGEDCEESPAKRFAADAFGLRGGAPPSSLKAKAIKLWGSIANWKSALTSWLKSKAGEIRNAWIQLKQGLCKTNVIIAWKFLNGLPWFTKLWNYAYGESGGSGFGPTLEGGWSWDWLKPPPASNAPPAAAAPAPPDAAPPPSFIDKAKAKVSEKVAGIKAKVSPIMTSLRVLLWVVVGVTCVLMLLGTPIANAVMVAAMVTFAGWKMTSYLTGKAKAAWTEMTAYFDPVVQAANKVSDVGVAVAEHVGDAAVVIGNAAVAAGNEARESVNENPGRVGVWGAVGAVLGGPFGAAVGAASAVIVNSLSRAVASVGGIPADEQQLADAAAQEVAHDGADVQRLSEEAVNTGLALLRTQTLLLTENGEAPLDRARLDRLYPQQLDPPDDPTSNKVPEKPASKGFWGSWFGSGMSGGSMDEDPSNLADVLAVLASLPGQDDEEEEDPQEMEGSGLGRCWLKGQADC